MQERFESVPGGENAPGAAFNQAPGELGSMLENLLGGARQQLSAETVEGVAGGGAVRVSMDGEQNVLAVKIAPDVVNPDDIELLEELIVSAMADAARQAQQVKMKSVTALADMFGLGGITSGDEGPRGG